jgi:predicted ATP-dependent serine protease
MSNDFEINVTKTQLEIYNEDRLKSFCPTEFKFLRAHRGLRPSSMHLLIAKSGNGKSTLARTIMVELLQNGKKCFLWLSEETEEEYLGEFNFCNLEFEQGDFKIFSELEYKSNNLIGEIKKCIIENNIKYLFFDNLTTSPWYSDDTKLQAKKVAELKQLISETGVCLIIFCHTDAKVGETFGLIDQNNIRGNKSITNNAHFIYVLQQFENDFDGIISVIRIIKNRTQNPQHKIFRLNYLKDKRVYVGDEAITFERFKEYFTGRNRL